MFIRLNCCFIFSEGLLMGEKGIKEKKREKKFSILKLYIGIVYFIIYGVLILLLFLINIFFKFI